MIVGLATVFLREADALDFAEDFFLSVKVADVSASGADVWAWDVVDSSGSKVAF